MAFEERWTCRLCNRVAGGAEEWVLFHGKKVHERCATFALNPFLDDLKAKVAHHAKMLRIGRVGEEFLAALERERFLSREDGGVQLRMPHRIDAWRTLFAIIGRHTVKADPGNYAPLNRFVHEKLGADLPPFPIAEAASLIEVPATHAV